MNEIKNQIDAYAATITDVLVHQMDKDASEIMKCYIDEMVDLVMMTPDPLDGFLRIPLRTEEPLTMIPFNPISPQRLHAAVMRAVKSDIALDWRSKAMKHCRRWDDGPCRHLANSIQVVAAKRGIKGALVWVRRCIHCMFQQDGFLMDAYECIPEANEVPFEAEAERLRVFDNSIPELIQAIEHELELMETAHATTD